MTDFNPTKAHPNYFSNWLPNIRLILRRVRGEGGRFLSNIRCFVRRLQWSVLSNKMTSFKKKRSRSSRKHHAPNNSRKSPTIPKIISTMVSQQDLTSVKVILEMIIPLRSVLDLVWVSLGRGPWGSTKWHSTATWTKITYPNRVTAIKATTETEAEPKLKVEKSKIVMKT